MRPPVLRRPLTAAAILLAAVLAWPAAAAGREARIVGGEEVASGAYPWTVALVAADRPAGEGLLCGGSLLSARVVLTAAHCVEAIAPSQIDAVVSRTTLSRTGGQRIAVREIAVHPGAETDAFRRDVALLLLAAPADDPPAIGLVGPRDSADDALWATANDLTVTGWGVFGPDSGSSDRLRAARVPRVADADCTAAFGAAFQASDMFCAGAPEGGRDTCQGDSGGPAAVPLDAQPDSFDPSRWRVVGVTSFGIGCALPDFPGVYARLASGLRDFVLTDPATQPPAFFQPHPVAPPFFGDATPVVGETVKCYDARWANVPRSRSYTIASVRDGSRRTLTAGRTHVVGPADVGAQLICAVVAAPARGAGGEGYAESARTAVVAAEQEPRPAPQPQPAPPPAPPAPAPAAQPAPAPASPTPRPRPSIRDLDVVAPRVTSIRRSCSRGRRCTLAVTLLDTAPSAGIAGVRATIVSRERVRCRTRPRTCVRTRTRVLRAVALGRNLFRLRTFVLRPGRHRISVTATDRAGNTTLVPRRIAFSVSARRAR